MTENSKITRRTFLLILVSFIAVLAGAVAIFDFERVVINILKEDLQHLKIDENSFEKFAKEAHRKDHWSGKYFDWKKKQLIKFGFLLGGILPSFPYKYKYLQYRSDIVGDYLLSTDFFANKMDENRTINYVGLYDPYLRPCSNPFSNMYYPEA